MEATHHALQCGLYKTDPYRAGVTGMCSEGGYCLTAKAWGQAGVKWEPEGFFGKSVVLDGVLLGQTGEGEFS